MSDDEVGAKGQDFFQAAGGLKVSTARSELAERIITAIAIGAYSPGEQLPSERDLSEWQGVSRVTVRGALEIVRKRGLLSSKRGRGGGTFVANVDLEQVVMGFTQRMLEAEIPRLREFVDFRCLIAALEARTAAERRSSEQARKLTLILEEFLAAGDPATARRVDVALHQQITIMAGNDQLAALAAELNSKATMGFGAEPYPSHYLQRARDEHTDLVESIVTQDLERAYQSAYRHFALTLEIVEEAFLKSNAGTEVIQR
ncbi:FadR/GntR family transcriptional regulator [Pararhizobium qamdonense]|uniref:FadR/GntR family transcriptional regulator n=1 Tax=Pararhizobium qamdonense TaxID=3031126 RepID=UPI0023E32626|nr:FCD domain-containing protein [Pararhizobium qamdonense]